MSAALYSLGRWCFRHGKRVLAIWVAVAVLLGVLGGVLFTRFDDTFDIPGSSSQEALEQLHMTFPQGAALTATAVVVVPEGRNVADLRGEIEPLLDEFEAVDLVDEARSPWFKYAHGQTSPDGRAALVSLSLTVTEVSSLEALQPIVDAAPVSYTHLTLPTKA